MSLFNRKSKQPSSNLDEFHAALTANVAIQGITYVEAFVQHLDNASLGACSRKTVDQYLFGMGFCVTDIQLLADEYFRIVDERNNG